MATNVSQARLLDRIERTLLELETKEILFRKKDRRGNQWEDIGATEKSCV
jgi:hypothetical protein